MIRRFFSLCLINHIRGDTASNFGVRGVEHGVRVDTFPVGQYTEARTANYYVPDKDTGLTARAGLAGQRQQSEKSSVDVMAYFPNGWKHQLC